MAEAKEFKPGQRVSFFRLHDKATKLFGTVVKDVKGFLHIETEAANGSVSRIEEADPKDVTAAAAEEAAEPTVAPTSSGGSDAEKEKAAQESPSEETAKPEAQ